MERVRRLEAVGSAALAALAAHLPGLRHEVLTNRTVGVAEADLAGVG
jgi:hypothetical protein